MVDGPAGRAGARGRAGGAGGRPAGRRASSRRSTAVPPTGSRSPPRPGSPASTRRRPASPTRRRWPGARTAPRPGSDSTSPAGPPASTRAAVGREAAERATAMIGAAKPESRSCPVVLDPTVAASFVGLIGGVLGADAVQRGRSPFAERLGDEVAGQALVLHDDGLDPAGPASSPFDGEGVARAPHRADRGRDAALLPLRHLQRQPRRRPTIDRQRRPRRLPRPAPGLRFEPRRRNRRARPLRAGRRGRGGCPRHRRRRPAFRRQPRHRRLLGRRLGDRDTRRRARRAAARVHDRQRPRLDAALGAGGRRGGALGPVRRLGRDAAAADRRDDRGGCLSPAGARSPPGHAYAAATVRLRPTFNPTMETEELRRDKG